MFQDSFVGARKWFLEGRQSSPRQCERDRDRHHSGENHGLSVAQPPHPVFPYTGRNGPGKVGEKFGDFWGRSGDFGAVSFRFALDTQD
jgi:hypothetical protein